MRRSWFDHVRKTRVKMSKQENAPVSHRDAMRSASETWGAVKEKLIKAKARQDRKIAKLAKQQKNQ